MIFDAQTKFSTAQAITAAAASTNIIDLGAAGIPYGASAALSRDLGVGGEVPLRIQVVEKFLTLTNLKVAVQTSVDEAFTSPITVLETEAIPVASLLAGYQFNIDRFPLKTANRYVRLYYTPTGTTATAGKVTAGVVVANQQNPV